MAESDSTANIPYSVSRAYFRDLINTANTAKLYKLAEQGFYYDDYQHMARLLPLHIPSSTQVVVKYDSKTDLNCYMCECLFNVTPFTSHAGSVYLDILFRFSRDMSRCAKIIPRLSKYTTMTNSDVLCHKLLVYFMSKAVPHAFNTIDNIITPGRLYEICEHYKNINRRFNCDELIDDNLMLIIEHFVIYYSGVFDSLTLTIIKKCVILYRYGFHKLAIVIIKSITKHSDNIYTNIKSTYIFETIVMLTDCLNYGILDHDKIENSFLLQIINNRKTTIDILTCSKIFIPDIESIIISYISY